MLKKILTLGLIVGLTALWALPALRPGTAALPGPVYEGICELWQVDLFEGGRGSRAGFLREAAADFCQEHPGSLVMVRALTGEEAAYYRRGRNAHPHGIPKNATPAQYAKATGVEALFGALFLLGRMQRANELFAAFMEVPDAL